MPEEHDQVLQTCTRSVSLSTSTGINLCHASHVHMPACSSTQLRLRSAHGAWQQHASTQHTPVRTHTHTHTHAPAMYVSASTIMAEARAGFILVPAGDMPRPLHRQSVSSSLSGTALPAEQHAGGAGQQHPTVYRPHLNLDLAGAQKDI